MVQGLVSRFGSHVLFPILSLNVLSQGLVPRLGSKVVYQGWVPITKGGSQGWVPRMGHKARSQDLVSWLFPMYGFLGCLPRLGPKAGLLRLNSNVLVLMSSPRVLSCGLETRLGDKVQSHS